MPVNIHGKQYYTVAERIQEAGKALVKVETEVLTHEPNIVIKATIQIDDDGGLGRTFTGISAANPSKAIEKQSPYEVAETSALGRALGFAGYGLNESIASAEEMKKAVFDSKPGESSETIAKRMDNRSQACPDCHAPAGKAHASTCPTLQ